MPAPASLALIPGLRLMPDTDSDFEDDYSGDEVEENDNADKDDDADDDEDAPEPGLYTTVQLGYADPPSHALALRRDYFPSKLGGRPAWLNPAALPPASSLCCSVCAAPLALLAQLYAPLPGDAAAFHRALYLFACRRASCLAAAPTAAVRAFRCSLPRENPFYAASAPVPPPASAPAATVGRDSAGRAVSTTAKTSAAASTGAAAAAGATELPAHLPVDVLPFAGSPTCPVCALPTAHATATATAAVTDDGEQGALSPVSPITPSLTEATAPIAVAAANASAVSTGDASYCCPAHRAVDAAAAVTGSAITTAAFTARALARELAVLPAFEVNTEEECLPTYKQQVALSTAKGHLAGAKAAELASADSKGKKDGEAKGAGAAKNSDKVGAKLSSMVGEYEAARAKMTEEERFVTDRVFLDEGSTNPKPSSGSKDDKDGKEGKITGKDSKLDAELEASIAGEISARDALLQAKKDRSDAVHVAFSARVECNPEQCLRYVPHHKRVQAVHTAEMTGASGTTSARPVWVGKRRRVAHAPDCERCGGARDVEFQVMPQVLYFLETEARKTLERAHKHRVKIHKDAVNGVLREEDALDFGTIVVYTCRNNCTGAAADEKMGYVQEFAYAQPPQT